MMYPKELFARQAEEMANCLLSLEEGNFEAIKFYHYANRYVKELQEAISQVKEQAIDEIRGGAYIDGYDAAVTEGRAIYSFTEIPQWCEAKKRLSIIEQRAKAAAKSGAGGVIDENGEVIDAAAFIKSADYITIKKKK